ncbi:MAG: hypothetical protein LBR39_03575 [Coriobacteriales bacterium]|jgi:mannose-1-phosphate guanylyltransferase|nr:hypothetical protein [Coriobacteriales bacterium]
MNQQPLPHLYGVLLLGNSASQLWPLSRPDAPLELARDNLSGVSPLELACLALRPFSAEPLLIAVSGSQVQAVEQHLQESQTCRGLTYRLLTEPYPRGGALTCALAANRLKLVDPNAIMLVFPVGQSFSQDDRWPAAINRAYQVCTANRIALLAASEPPNNDAVSNPKPREWRDSDASSRKTPEAAITSQSSPASQPSPTHEAFQSADSRQPIGLIRPGEELHGTTGAFASRSYLAHPTTGQIWRGQQLKALWSTHIYMLRADQLLSELRHAAANPELPDAPSAQRIAETARFFVSLEESSWADADARELVATLPKESFEELVFESTSCLAVIPTSLEFSDLTSLAGLEAQLTADSAGNRLDGNVQAASGRNNTVLSTSGRQIVLQGLENIVVLDTEDATLIAARHTLPTLQAPAANLPGTG